MKALLTVILVTLGFVIHIGVMINGWGIDPFNWLWIIGGGLTSLLLSVGGLIVADFN